MNIRFAQVTRLVYEMRELMHNPVVLVVALLFVGTCLAALMLFSGALEGFFNRLYGFLD
jgi:hypothetical protein